MKSVSDYKIPHTGPEDAEVFFIQDFPSTVDEMFEKPMQGNAGEVLDDLLNVHNMTREDVRIGSLLNYTPAANQFFKASSTWQLEESKVELTNYLRNCKHKVLVPCGPHSLEFLTGHTELDKRRGSVYRYKHLHVIPIQELYYTKKDGSRNAALLRDFGKILRVAKEGWKETEFEMHIDPDFYQLQPLLERILASKRMFVDIETKKHTHYIRCIGFAWKEEEQYVAFCIYNNFRYFDGADTSNLLDDQFRNVLTQLLSSSVPKTFHNGMFDTLMLSENGIEVKNFDYDTMIAQHVIQPELPIGLDYCTSMYTDMNYYKDDGKTSGDRIDRVKLGVYNCKDVVATGLTQEGQKKELTDTTKKYLAYKMKQLPLAMHFSMTGMLVDKERQQELRERIEERKQKDYGTLAGIQLLHDWEVFKVSQHQKVNQFLYDCLGLQVKLNKDGKVTSDEDAIVSLLATVEKKIQDMKTEKGKESWRFKLATLKLILNIRGYDKLLSSYINAESSPDGRVRSWYKFWGTETGRWSASNWYDKTGLNGQTIPREVVE